MSNHVSVMEIYDKLIESGIDISPVNKLHLEQALEAFISQTFHADEFMDELLSGSDWSHEDQVRIRKTIEPYDGSKIFSVKSSLTTLIHSAFTRATVPHFAVNAPAKETNLER